MRFTDLLLRRKYVVPMALRALVHTKKKPGPWAQSHTHGPRVEDGQTDSYVSIRVYVYVLCVNACDLARLETLHSLPQVPVPRRACVRPAEDLFAL